MKKEASRNQDISRIAAIRQWMASPNMPHVDDRVVIVVIALVVVGLGWLLWSKTEGVLSSPDRAQEFYEAKQKDEEAHGSTLNRGLGAYVYHKYIDKKGPAPDMSGVGVPPPPGGAGIPAIPSAATSGASGSGR